MLSRTRLSGLAAFKAAVYSSFFRLLREYTVMGFYTTRIGLEELGYPGLRTYSKSPECPHVNDPEHRHLGGHNG